MLTNVVRHKCLPFAAVLMDTWYATRQMMRFIEALHLVYYCPLKANRLVDETDGQKPYVHVSTLSWSEQDLEPGKLIKIKDFPKGHRVKLFRLVVSTRRTDYVVTNDVTQNSLLDADQVCAWRWKIEQFHREAKRLTGFEKCQCRKAQIQRNHIACAFLVWTRLAQLARQAGQTLYSTKRGLLDEYLRSQLRNLDLVMTFA
jgi:Transposase DDE domain